MYVPVDDNSHSDESVAEVDEEDEEVFEVTDLDTVEIVRHETESKTVSQAETRLKHHHPVKKGLKILFIKQ